jgi:hypothetical protein
MLALTLRCVLGLVANSFAVILVACGGGTSSSTSTYNNLNPKVLPPGVTAPSQAIRNANLQAETGWQTCIGTCANAPIPLKYTLMQNVASPSLNSGGTTNFDGVSFDGVLQPIAVSLPPETQSQASELLGVHIQLDNAKTVSGYTVFVDDWSLYSW